MDEEEGLECPVCLDPYNEGSHIPKMMACLHTLCATCIVDLVLTGETKTGNIYSGSLVEPKIPRSRRFPCPLCRETINTDRVQTNRYILAHLRDIKRLAFRNSQGPPSVPRESPPIRSPSQQSHDVSDIPPPPPPIWTIPTLKKKASKNQFLKFNNPTGAAKSQGKLFKPPKPPNGPPPPPPNLKTGKPKQNTPFPPRVPPPQGPPLHRAPRPPMGVPDPRHVRVPTNGPPPPPPNLKTGKQKQNTPLPPPPQGPPLHRAPVPPMGVPDPRHVRVPTGVTSHPQNTQLPQTWTANQMSSSPQILITQPIPAYNPYYDPDTSKNRPVCPPKPAALTNAWQANRPTPPASLPVSSNWRAPSQTSSTTPVAGCPTIIPKLPPATTLHQPNTPATTFHAHVGLGNNGNATLYPAIPEEPLTPSAPPPPPDATGMWCRTCEGPGKMTCDGHELVPLLQEREVDFIIELQRKIEQRLEQEAKDFEMARAIQETYIDNPPRISEAHTITQRDENGVNNTKMVDLSKNSWADLRDTVNTSCDPNLLMECFKEFDRRHIEYRRTVRRKNKNVPRPPIAKNIFENV